MFSTLSLNRCSFRPLLWLILALTLTGCSHRNLIKSGEQYIAAGSFERGVSEFEQALQEKPNHQPTIDKLRQAQDNLNAWANQLETKADLAKDRQQLGKAMLLYSKVAQLTNSPSAVNQYKAIYKKLRQQSALKVALLSNGVGIANSDLAAVSGIILTNNKNTDQTLSFSQSNPVFEIQQSTLTKTAEFISGYEIRTNPEFIRIQHDIRHFQDNRQHLRSKLSRANRQLNQQSSQLQSLTQQHNAIRQRLLQQDLSAASVNKYQQQQSRIDSKISQTKQLQTKDRQLRDKVKHEMSHEHNELSHLIDELAVTPGVVSMPVYSDYNYQAKLQVNSLSAQLYLNYNNGKTTSTRIAQAIVSDQDESHQAHPTIQLAFNPMTIQNQQQLSPLLNTQLRKVSQRLLDELVDEQRHSYIRLASQSIDIDQTFSLWVAHGMVSKNGAIDLIAAKIKQSLIIEYGVGGEFEVNALLHRYQ